MCPEMMHMVMMNGGDEIRPPTPYRVVFAVPALLACRGGAVEECQRAAVCALHHARLQPLPTLSITSRAQPQIQAVEHMESVSELGHAKLHLPLHKFGVCCDMEEFWSGHWPLCGHADGKDTVYHY